MLLEEHFNTYADQLSRYAIVHAAGSEDADLDFSFGPFYLARGQELTRRVKLQRQLLKKQRKK
jgi:hypothetical protein